jgi:ABC-type branched-subunit amino acid transport system substrate-binding protein
VSNHPRRPVGADLSATRPGEGGNGAGLEPSQDDIRIGLLHALSGGLSVTETSIHHGALLAVEQINAAGGIDGRRILPLVEDYASDMSVAALRARKLLRSDGVTACVGGFTSASRAAMLPAFRSHGAMLLFPTFYEGLEQDPHVVYAGAVPNQFLLDYVSWIVRTLGTRIYMVGSDYVYPRTMGAMIRRMVGEAGAVMAADRYVPLGCLDFTSVIDEIAALRPDVVISNIVGSDSVPAFYRQFRLAGHTAASLPIAATVTTEIELQAMGSEYGVGHFMTATYFGSLRNAANAAYVEAIRSRFGPSAVTHVTQVGAYNAVWLFALAAARAGTLSLESLRASFVGTSFADNPEGWPLMVHANHHTDHPSYIGCARPDGQYDVVADFPPRRPEPYPSVIVPESRRPPASMPW